MVGLHGTSRVSRTVRLYGAIVILAMIVGAVASVIAMRERDIEDWRRQMGSISLLLTEQTSQTVFAAYLVLDAVTERVRQAEVSDQASFRARLSTPEMFQVLREKIHGLPQVDVASIVAANGDNINFSRSYPVPPINLAERDYFKAHKADPNLGDFISQPVRNKGNGKWTFYISRRLNDARGNFLGLVLVGMSVEVITNFYERVARNLGEGATISLFRSDLTLLTRWPHRDEVIGTVNRSGSAFEIVEMRKKNEDVVLRSTPRFSTGESVLRLSAVRKAERYPLYVVFVVTDDLFLASWRRSMVFIAAVTLAGVLILSFGLMALVRNLEQREADMEEMGRLKLAAESANLAKSRFLATMSHEIRTPMNGMLGMAQMLLSPNLKPGDQQDYARTILTSGQTLLTLLNDVLDFSKIEAGKFKFESVVFEPGQIIHDTTSLFAGYAGNKDLRLDGAWYGPPGQRYEADAYRLRQMLSNLVGNGIKFTASGQIHVEGREIRRDGESAMLEFSVSDTGMGIPADKQGLLFHPFSQVDTSTTREFGGSGLGLSIVSSLARLMGGDVGVESEQGKGARFWFRIRADIVPMGEDSRQAGRADTAGPVPATWRGRVLVVEDDPTNRRVVEALLTKLGLAVTLANDGQEGVKAMQAAERPDLVLMDIHMPVLDGYGATEQIRRWEQNKGMARLPVVALSADVFAAARERAMLAGMDDFLSKPISVDALKSILGKWLGAGSAALPGMPVRSGTRSLDKPRFLDLVAEIEPLLAQNKFDAIGRFKDLQDLAADTFLATEIDEIAAMLGQFRFDAALERLHRVAATQDGVS